MPHFVTLIPSSVKNIGVMTFTWKSSAQRVTMRFLLIASTNRDGRSPVLA